MTRRVDSQLLSKHIIEDIEYMIQRVKSLGPENFNILDINRNIDTSSLLQGDLFFANQSCVNGVDMLKINQMIAYLKANTVRELVEIYEIPSFQFNGTMSDGEDSDGNEITKSENRLDKSSLVGQTLGLLEEKEKDKDWILEHLKRKKIRLKISSIHNSYEILNASPVSFIKYLYRTLKGDKFAISEVRTLTKTFHWFFTDIVSSSDPSMNTKAQVRKINVLNSQVNKTETFKNRDPKSTEDPCPCKVNAGLKGIY